MRNMLLITKDKERSSTAVTVAAGASTAVTAAARANTAVSVVARALLVLLMERVLPVSR
jgi:hypothetical protein